MFKAAKAYRRTEEKVTKKLDKALIELRASGLKKKKGSKGIQKQRRGPNVKKSRDDERFLKRMRGGR